MKIQLTVTLELNEDQKRAWANKYGLGMDEVASDATQYLGALVREHIEQMPHLQMEYASLADFRLS